MKNILQFFIVNLLTLSMINCEVRLIKGNERELEVLQKSFLKYIVCTMGPEAFSLERYIKPNRKFVAKTYLAYPKVEYYLLEDEKDILTLILRLGDRFLEWYYLDVKIPVPNLNS